MKFRLIAFLGSVANLAGYPGVVREGAYTSSDVKVSVKKSALYTVITVGDVAVYFYRLGGGFG